MLAQNKIKYLYIAMFFFFLNVLFFRFQTLNLIMKCVKIIFE